MILRSNCSASSSSDFPRLGSDSDATFTWADEQYLLEQGVEPWSELPLWIPEADDALSTVNCAKAFAAALTVRPLTETVRDTLAWDATRPSDHEWRAGLSAERERGVLQNGHEHVRSHSETGGTHAYSHKGR